MPLQYEANSPLDLAEWFEKKSEAHKKLAAARRTNREKQHDLSCAETWSSAADIIRNTTFKGNT